VKERISILLALGGTLLVLIACGFVPTHGTPRTVAKAPASALNVSLTVSNQFAGADLLGLTVTIEARFADASGTFDLSGKQKITCEGADLAVHNLRIPRQHAGGVYTCVYTDDQGKQTTLLVPAPQGHFAMIDLLPNATITIPFSAKRPVPTTRFSGSRRPPEYTSTLHLRYLFPPLPQGATATLSAPAWATRPSLGVGGIDEPATGTYDLSDAQEAYGNGFESFQPVPGSLGVGATIIWPALPPGGFHSVKVTYLDGFNFPVQWVSA
jgi:hypothetical protein